MALSVDALTQPLLRRRVKFLFKTLILAAILTGLGVWSVGTALVQPAPANVGPAPREISAIDVEIPSNSGSTLHGWYIETPGSNAAIVLFHGVRGNRRHLRDRARLLQKEGYSVLMIDFQAHGESPGKEITFGYLESRDVEAAIGWLHQRLPNARVGAVGISMGGASLALARHPLKLDAVVLESAYSTLDAAVENRVKMVMGTLGLLAKPFLTAQLKPRIGVGLDYFRPIDHLSDIGCPILIAGGEADKRTLASETRAMYAASPMPKQLWIVRNASHQDLLRASPDEYKKMVLGFFQTYLK